jgi:polyisoprenoid-binding protein YceI
VKILRSSEGEDFTVIGATRAVNGQISGDETDPASAQVSVVVDVRTLATDSGRRNGAIQRFILETGIPENQIATFEATSISGLPENITIGQPFEFQITGNLTAHGVSKELTFNGSATLVSETRLEGTTSTETLFTEFVSVFSLPSQVASVEEALILEIDFVAVKQ